MGSLIIGHWPLDGSHIALPTIKGISRFGNNGTATDVSLTTGIHGEANGAGLFNGTTSKIDLGSGIIGIKPLTIETWIHPTDWGGGNLGRIIDNGSILWFLDNPASQEYFVFSSNGGAERAYPANNSIVLNNWHHVCITITAAGIANVYMNGVLSGAANQDSGTPAIGTTNTFIGNRDDGLRAFDGKIAKMRFYSYVMSAWQVKRLYDSYGV